MNKTVKRFIAYFIDMLIISIISMSIGYLPLFNNNLNDYKKEVKEYNKEYTNYLSFKTNLEKYYNDKKINNKEYEKLEKYDNYNNYLNKYYKNNNISKKNYSKLIGDIDKDWLKKNKQYNYDISSKSKIDNIISFIVIIAYFMTCNLLTKGKTIGKIIMKLKIVSNDDNKEPSCFNYLIRCLILYNPLYYITIIIGTYLLKVNEFYLWSYAMSNIKNYLEIIIIIMIIMRKDKRGLHELLSKTKVIDITDNNNPKEDDENITIIRKDNKLKNRNKSKNKKIILEEE